MQIYKTAEYKPHFYAKSRVATRDFYEIQGNRFLSSGQFVAHSLSIINHIGDMRLISHAILHD